MGRLVTGGAGYLGAARDLGRRATRDRPETVAGAGQSWRALEPL